METQKPSNSPLRQRMIEDMRMRKFGEKTQSQYLRAVRQFAKYLGRSPDSASVEELRNYQLYLVDNGTSPASLNSAICGLKFFFGITLDRPEAMAKMKPVHLPRKLPEILSPDEVKRLMLTPVNGEITDREPHDGYLVLQGGTPEVAAFISSHWK